MRQVIHCHDRQWHCMVGIYSLSKNLLQLAVSAAEDKKIKFDAETSAFQLLKFSKQNKLRNLHLTSKLIIDLMNTLHIC